MASGLLITASCALPQPLSGARLSGLCTAVVLAGERHLPFRGAAHNLPWRRWQQEQKRTGAVAGGNGLSSSPTYTTHPCAARTRRQRHVRMASKAGRPRGSHVTGLFTASRNPASSPPAKTCLGPEQAGPEAAPQTAPPVAGARKWKCEVCALHSYPLIRVGLTAYLVGCSVCGLLCLCLWWGFFWVDEAPTLLHTKLLLLTLAMGHTGWDNGVHLLCPPLLPRSGIAGSVDAWGPYIFDTLAKSFIHSFPPP